MTTPCSSAAPFSRWHKVHGQAVHEWGFPREVPWWIALRYGWQTWDKLFSTRFDFNKYDKRK